MFCPKCASQNLEGASFCRTCGANISLVPQALSGQLPETQAEPVEGDSCLPRKRRGKQPTLDHAIKNIFMGIGFLAVAIALSFSIIGRVWWFWMLIPAFSMLGTGVAQYIRLKDEQKRTEFRGIPVQPLVAGPPRINQLPRRNTGELIPPPASVTEGTTRHLGAEAPTTHLDASADSNN